MPFAALQDFEHFGVSYRAGEALPKRARNWLDLRKLQRLGLVSWNQDAAQAESPPAAARQAPAGKPLAEEEAEQGEPEADASSEPETERKPKKKRASKKRAA